MRDLRIVGLWLALLILVTNAAFAVPGTRKISGTSELLGVWLDGAYSTGDQTFGGQIGINEIAPAGGVTIALAASPNTNVTVPATVVVPEGESTVWFEITLKPVTATHTITITATVGSSTQTATFELQPTTIREFYATSAVGGGSEGTGELGLNGPAPAGGVTVTLASSANCIPLPQSVTIAEGTYATSFTFTAAAVSSSVSATLTAAHGTTTTLTAPVDVLPAVPAEVVFDSSDLGDNDSATGTVVLYAPAPSGGLTVTLAANTPAHLSVPSSVTVPQG